MTQDISTLTKRASIERLAKESRASHQQLSDRNPTFQNTMQSNANAVRLNKLFSDLQNKFSGRQEEVARLIEEQVAARTDDLFKKAYFDALTHLPNRAYFKDLMGQVLTRATETETSFTLLFLDLDGFKQVNDLQGHHTGDDLLKHVSARLVSSVRENDIVARIGGDEFVVLLTDSEDDRAVIEQISTRIIDNVSKSYYLNKAETRISASMGIGLFPSDGKTTSELMENSDAALYFAKENGKSQFRFYSDMVKQEANPSASLTLAEAIQNNNISTQVQPLVDLFDNRIIGASLLPFWQQEAAEQGTWESWQGLVESSNQALTLGRWLFDSACFYGKQWQKIDAQFEVMVPILPELLLQENSVTKLIARANHFGMPIDKLKLSISLKDLNTGLVEKISQLSKQGFQIALTDLGSENLDINLLASLSVNELSFNGAWLREKMANPPGQKWVQALIQMGKSLDAIMVATGVESEACYLQLKAWGCEVGQGTYWSKAINSENFESLIK